MDCEPPRRYTLLQETVGGFFVALFSCVGLVSGMIAGHFLSPGSEAAAQEAEFDDQFSPPTPDDVADEIGAQLDIFLSEPDDVSEALSVPKALLDLTGLTPHSKLDKLERDRWDAGMLLSSKLASVGLLEASSSLRQCHSFQTIAKCDGCYKISRFWNRCDIFYCPQCSPRLSKKRLDGLMFFVEKMKQPKHLVLTFRNVDTLTHDYIRSCQLALSKFRRRRLFRGVRSGLWAMEITNKGAGFHLHFHLVIDSPWMDVRQISATWKACTDCESSVVWIEDAARGSLRANLPRYVTKYTGKGFRPQDWEAALLGQFVTAISGCRTFGVFGELLGARKEWTDFLKATRQSRRTCECGCCSKTYFSQSEFQWYHERCHIEWESKPRPPTREDLQCFLQLPEPLDYP